MLRRAHIRGYKCLEDVAVDLAPFTVLIGRNDSGKSSFLQAIAEPTHVRATGAPSADARAVSASGDWTVRLDGESKAVLQRSSRPMNLSTGSANDRGLEHRPADIVSAPLWLQNFAELVLTDPIALDPEQIRQHSTPPNNDKTTLQQLVDGRGRGVSAYLAMLALGDRKRFDTIEKALSDVTHERVKDIIVRDAGGSVYELHFRLLNGRVIPAAQLSQGLLLYLAFLSIVHHHPTPAAILIEEPERGLHPLRLAELVALLRTLTERGVQVILSTHSPDLLSACDPREVRIFHRPNADSPTTVHVLPGDFDRRAMREPLGQVWAARGEEGLLDLLGQPIAPAIQADPK